MRIGLETRGGPLRDAELDLDDFAYSDLVLLRGACDAELARREAAEKFMRMRDALEREERLLQPATPTGELR